MHGMIMLASVPEPAEGWCSCIDDHARSPRSLSLPKGRVASMVMPVPEPVEGPVPEPAEGVEGAEGVKGCSCIE